MPDTIKVVLLAESHVCTTHHDSLCVVTLPPDSNLPGYPNEYVRFVYCLGYGESKLLDAPIANNRGTWQYWKLLYSCCNGIANNDDFAPILHSGTPLLNDRLTNKIDLLQKLKQSGIWLIDTSIVGLYPNPTGLAYHDRLDILHLCWAHYTRPLLQNANPKMIICVGQSLGNALHTDLEEMNIPYHIVYQPNARLLAQEQIANLNTIHNICERYCGTIDTDHSHKCLN